MPTLLPLVIDGSYMVLGGLGGFRGSAAGGPDPPPAVVAGAAGATPSYSLRQASMVFASTNA
jgi:hypothetical protein